MEPYIEKAIHDWSDESVRIILTPSKVAKNNYYYIQEIGYFKAGQQYFTERANLNSFLFVYTLSGEGILEYENKKYTLAKNQGFFIHCMNHQMYKTSPNKKWEFLWVHFNGSSSRGYYDQFSLQNHPVVTFHEKSTIPNTLREMIHIQQKRNTTTEILTSQMLVNLLTTILIENHHSHKDHFHVPPFIFAIVQEIERNFCQEIKLDDLALKYSVSKYHLVKEFKKYIGSTPHEYIIQCRINLAKELLKYSHEPVAEIAEKVGIPHTSHFINLFKSRVDETPLAFRKKWK